MFKQVFITLISVFFLNVISFAQKEIDLNNYIIVSAINVEGNKKTKDFIIIRELPFGIGDTLLKRNLSEIFKQAAIQVYNTNLFIETKLDSVVDVNNTMIAVTVHVKERWYIYPQPQFSLTDRSFNEWYQTYNADLKRVVYGMNFTHDNFSGRRDELSITALSGYARNLSFDYSNPYSNSKLTEGYSIFANYTENKELGYITNYFERVLPFSKKDSGLFVRKNFNAGGSYNRRKSAFKRDGFSIDFNYLKVNDSVIDTKYNPQYFNSAKSEQTFIDISYGVASANTNKNAYPTKGEIYNYGITKRGFGFSGGTNSLILNGSYHKFISHKHNFFSDFKIAGNLKLPFKQAYINRRAIGFGNLNMRGLELYIIDGVAATTFNYTFRKKLFYLKIPMPFKIKVLPYIPFTVFAKTYTDVGFSYMPSDYSTRLNNKLLGTAGIGIDVLSVYDIVLRLNYSFNQLGEKRLFLQ